MRAPRSLTTALSLAAVLGLAACGGDDEPSFSERTLKFTERGTDNFGFTDSPPKTEMGREGPREFSNGDQLTFSSDLLDRPARDVGDLDVTCTVTRPGGFQDSHQNCQGTATLPGGSIALARGGRVFGGGDASGAVVGGTADYAGATGVFSETEQSEGRTQYTIDLVLPQ
jgi:hypothetical protein